MGRRAVLAHPLLIRCCAAAAALWAAGAVWTAAGHILRWARFRRRLRDRSACGEAEQACFRAVCREMGIQEGRVGLWKSRQVPVPILTGLLRPQVLLPTGTYSREQLETIFTHELTHYRHRDLWLKLGAAAAGVAGWFNPAARMLRVQVEQWTEYACDGVCCGSPEGVKPYFTVLVQMCQQAGSRESWMASSLVKQKHELVVRVEKMTRYYQGKHPGRARQTAVCTALIVVCLLISTTASAQAAGLYRLAYAATASETEEEYIPVEYEEYTASVPDSGVEIVEMELIQSTKSTDFICSFNWEAPNRVLLMSGAIQADKGQKIRISFLILSPDQTVIAGICNPEGEMRYISATDGAYHDFEIDETGTYYFCVQNASGSAVSVVGNVCVVD